MSRTKIRPLAEALSLYGCHSLCIAKIERLVKGMTRAEEIRREAAIVQRALKRSERNYILSARFDKAQEMAAMSKGIGSTIAGVTAMLEHAEVRAA
jgi:hypothetical protein